MYYILVINAGSSSVKYQLIDMDTKGVMASGVAERVGFPGSHLKHKSVNGKFEVDQDMADHTDAIKLVLDALVNPEYGVLKSMDEIRAVGHRVLHGGADFSGSVLINDEVMQAIKDNIPLGPLHNPANIMGINACKSLMPNTPMVAVFDTAFHQTMPPKAYLYGLPYEDYTELKIRKYGFHGTSHRYVSALAAEAAGKPVEDSKVIVCHLGNGSSLSAVLNGKCVDTSMGLTPLEGVLMGTRSGSMDPAVVTTLMDRRGMTSAEVNNYLNKKSGVLGLSGISSDFRDLEAASNEGNERAKLAVKAFSYQVKKYVGSYIAVMDGCDVIAFTGGVGENDCTVRKQVLSDLSFFGIEFDEEVNSKYSGGKIYKEPGPVEITKPGSKIRAFIIPTNEELVIATDTYELTK